MRVLVIGGAGRVGSAALAACLEKDHIVTALVRSPSKLPQEIRSHPRLSVLRGDATSHVTLVDAMRDQDAIIQAAAYGSKSTQGTSDAEVMIQYIISAAKEVQASRRTRLLGGGIGGNGSGNGNGKGSREKSVRLWALSGEILVDIPRKKDVMEGDVIPIHPKYYKDYAFLRQEAHDMDWRLVCPGRMEMAEVRVLLYECR